jgi:hypothetical protein
MVMGENRCVNSKVGSFSVKDGPHARPESMTKPAWGTGKNHTARNNPRILNYKFARARRYLYFLKFIIKTRPPELPGSIPGKTGVWEAHMKKLHFRVAINATRERVWDTMIGPETFRKWTRAFAEGSYYEGSWDKGSKIKFLTPQGEGMSSEIADNRKHEFISIRHLGIIKNGKEDFTSPEVMAWAPSYENYTFTGRKGVTYVDVDMDIAPDYEKMFQDMWPKALDSLKKLCEGKARAA